jgi:acetyl esterase/lipase
LTQAGPSRFLRNAVALTVTGILFAIEIWTVVPAPSRILLVFAVLVPEVAPWGIALTLPAVVVAYVVGVGRVRALAVALGVGAFLCALWPMLQLPGTIAVSDAEMRRALGDRYDPTPGAAPFDVAEVFAGRSVSAPVAPEMDVPVPESGGVRLGLDVYRAAGAGPHPAVVLVYGGGWRYGSRADSAPIARDLARIGYTAIAVDYRHAPEARFPAQYDDVRAALETIARNAAAWNVDAERIALFGRSAGAELALLAAYRREPLHVAAVVAYYAPVDLTEGYRDPPVPDPADVRDLLEGYLGGPPGALPHAYAAASPLSLVRSGLPPTFLICGARDQLVLLRFQREMAAALRAHGDVVAALELPWSNHAFDAIPNGLGAQLARYYTARFLAATLGPATQPAAASAGR